MKVEIDLTAAGFGKYVIECSSRNNILLDIDRAIEKQKAFIYVSECEIKYEVKYIPYGALIKAPIIIREVKEDEDRTTIADALLD
jgi:hypothetical protein